MTEESYKRALAAFREECGKWLDELLNRCGGDREKASAELCQVMNDAFHAPRETVTEIAPGFDPEKIESVIKFLSRTCGYRFCVSDPVDRDKVSNEWVLKKKLHGKISELTVQLLEDEYLFVCSPTDGWGLAAFSADTLERAIVGWAEGRM